VATDAKGDGIDELTALFYASDLYSNGETWDTDPEAPPASFAGQLHRARLDLEAWRNNGVGHRGDGPIGFEPATELLKAQFSTTPWLICGILPEKAVVAIAGEPKTTKTWAGLEIAIALSSGTRAFGEFSVPQPRAVAVFLAEDDRHSVRNRLRALAHGQGLPPEEAVQKVYVRCRGSLDLQYDRDLCRLIADCRMYPEPVGLLILDPLRDLHQAEEDKSGPMSDVMARLRALRDILGCSVLFVHHTSKSSKETNGRREGQRMRGSSAIHGAVDGGVYMSLNDDTESHWMNKVVVELKAAKGAGRFTLTLDVQDDENGEARDARWAFARQDVSKAGDDLQAKIIGLLRAESQRSPLSPVPIPTDMVRARVRGQTWRVQDALKNLATARRARQVFVGRKSRGWVYVPAPEELDPMGIRTDPNPSEPVRFLGPSRPEPPPLGGSVGAPPTYGHSVRPPPSLNPPVETAQRLETNGLAAPGSSAQNSNGTGVAAKPGTGDPPTPSGVRARLRAALRTGPQATLSMGDPPPSGHAPPKTADNSVPSAHAVQCRSCGNLVDRLPHPGCRNPGGWYDDTLDGRNRVLRSPTGAVVALVPLDAEGKPTSEDPSKGGAS
jgi:regulatory protein RepA